MKILQKIIQASYFVICFILTFVIASKVEQDIQVNTYEIIIYVVSLILSFTKIQYTLKCYELEDK